MEPSSGGSGLPMLLLAVGLLNSGATEGDGLPNEGEKAPGDDEEDADEGAAATAEVTAAVTPARPGAACWALLGWAAAARSSGRPTDGCWAPRMRLRLMVGRKRVCMATVSLASPSSCCGGWCSRLLLLVDEEEEGEPAAAAAAPRPSAEDAQDGWDIERGDTRRGEAQAGQGAGESLVGRHAGVTCSRPGRISDRFDEENSEPPKEHTEIGIGWVEV